MIWIWGCALQSRPISSVFQKIGQNIELMAPMMCTGSGFRNSCRGDQPKECQSYILSNFWKAHEMFKKTGSVVSGGSRISPRRGRQLPGGGHQHKILPYFPKNCMKLKEFGPPGGRASLAPPLDPPLIKENGLLKWRYKDKLGGAVTI